jgi:hypothetical protein
MEPVQADWQATEEQTVAGLRVVEGVIKGQNGHTFAATLQLNASAKPKPGVVIAVGIGAEAAELARAGWAVLSLKPRGFDLPAAGRSGYSAVYQLAARGWLMGESIPTWAVTDLRAAVSAARKLPGVEPGPSVLLGRGPAGVIALLTSLFEPSVARVSMDRAPLSYLAFCRARSHQGLAELVIPGVLEDFDLPDVARVAGGRRLMVSNPVKPNGATMGPAEVGRWKAEFRGVEFRERGEGESAGKFFGRWLEGR